MPTRGRLCCVLFLGVVYSSVGLAEESGRGRPLTFDDRLARVAERTPAFGGFFIDETTQAVKVYSWNRTHSGQAEVRDAVRGAFAGELPALNVEVVAGRYGFRELKSWHDRMTGLLVQEGVVLTDIDDRTNRLKVGVVSVEAGWRVRDRLGELDVPGEAVDVVEMEPIRFLSSLRNRHRPLVGGLQILVGNNLGHCTLGLNVMRGTVAGFLTNSHCTAKRGGVQNTIEYQPSFGSTNRVGVETVDPLWVAGGACPPGLSCRYSDSAFIRRDSTVNGTRGKIARPADKSYAWNSTNQFRVVAEANPLVGQVATKVGRTTGRTQGPVTAVCVNVPVETYGLFCQSVATVVVGPGDSGSPVFRVTNSPQANDVRLLGLLWGGAGANMIFSPILAVQTSAELGALKVCAVGFTC